MTLNPSNPLKIALINFQSIREKKPQFFSFVDFYKPDIIVGTETWLTPDIYDSDYSPPLSLVSQFIGATVQIRKAEEL